MALEQLVKMMNQEETEKIIQYGSKIIQFPDKVILSNKKINIKDTIVIAGTPRSGTTWLMEVLTAIPGYTYLYEPINPIWFPKIRGVGFKSRTYLPPNTDWPEGKEYLEKTFTGRVFSLIPPIKFKAEPIMHRLLGNKLIVKFVRINRLLPWIVKRFDLRSIIFIIRHPCAVVASQLKTGFYGYFSDYPPYHKTSPTLENLINEAAKIDFLDKEVYNRLKNIKTQEEMLTAIWCLDNYIPLSLPKPYPWITIAYEKLVKEEKNEVIRLFNNIGEKNIPQSVIRRLKEPSMLTLGSDRNLISDADKQLSKWKKMLSEKQVKRILNIVNNFGLDFYNEDIEPDYDKIGG